MRDGRELRVLPRAGEAVEGGSCSARGWGWGWGAVACLCGGFWFSRVQSQGLGPGGGHFWLASCEPVACGPCKFVSISKSLVFESGKDSQIRSQIFWINSSRYNVLSGCIVKIIYLYIYQKNIQFEIEGVRHRVTNRKEANVEFENFFF